MSTATSSKLPWKYPSLQLTWIIQESNLVATEVALLIFNDAPLPHIWEVQSILVTLERWHIPVNMERLRRYNIVGLVVSKALPFVCIKRDFQQWPLPYLSCVCLLWWRLWYEPLVGNEKVSKYVPTKLTAPLDWLKAYMMHFRKYFHLNWNSQLKTEYFMID